jgi:hypothetical protein
VNWQLHAKIRRSSPQRVDSHLPNIATLHRCMHFSTCPDEVWSWRPRLPALNEVLSPVLPLLPGSACFISWNLPPSSFFSLELYTFRGERGVVKMMKKMDQLSYT